MDFSNGQTVCFSQGVDSSSKECFISVHVANSSDNTLVNQSCFCGDMMVA